jgi:hypothetical protein
MDRLFDDAAWREWEPAPVPRLRLQVLAALFVGLALGQLVPWDFSIRPSGRFFGKSLLMRGFFSGALASSQWLETLLPGIIALLAAVLAHRLAEEETIRNAPAGTGLLSVLIAVLGGWWMVGAAGIMVSLHQLPPRRDWGAFAAYLLAAPFLLPPFFARMGPGRGLWGLLGAAGVHAAFYGYFLLGRARVTEAFLFLPVLAAAALGLTLWCLADYAAARRRERAFYDALRREEARRRGRGGADPA